jgi:hypothetical protein
MQNPRGVLVIDAFGLSAEELRTATPAVYQWLLERVKPDTRPKQSSRNFAINGGFLVNRAARCAGALGGLSRYIATVETAKHRAFQFLDASILPDHMLVAIALDDAFWRWAFSPVSCTSNGHWQQAARWKIDRFTANPAASTLSPSPTKTPA